MAGGEGEEAASAEEEASSSSSATWESRRRGVYSTVASVRTLPASLVPASLVLSPSSPESKAAATVGSRAVMPRRNSANELIKDRNSSSASGRTEKRACSYKVRKEAPREGGRIIERVIR